MVTAEQIHRIIKEVQPHFVRTGDVEGYASLFTNDAVWWPLDRTTRIGHKQIAEGFAEIIAGNHTSPQFEAVDIQVSEACSVAAILGQETIVYDDGSPTEIVHSREIWVFREVSGEAKIWRMIWNQIPEKTNE